MSFRSVISVVYNVIYWKIRSYRLGLKLGSHKINRGVHFEGGNIIRSGVSIGKGVTFGRYSYASGPNTTIHSGVIGKFCSIGMGVKIGLDEHDYRMVSTHPFLYSRRFGGFVGEGNSCQEKEPPKIGHDVWIGANAIVMRGVCIGTGAVIGAGSIVTKDVEPYSICVGNPARKIASRFNAEVVKELESIRWYEWTDKQIRNRLEQFYSVSNFLKELG